MPREAQGCAQGRNGIGQCVSQEPRLASGNSGLSGLGLTQEYKRRKANELWKAELLDTGQPGQLCPPAKPHSKEPAREPEVTALDLQLLLSFLTAQGLTVGQGSVL